MDTEALAYQEFQKRVTDITWARLCSTDLTSAKLGKDALSIQKHQEMLTAAVKINRDKFLLIQGGIQPPPPPVLRK